MPKLPRISGAEAIRALQRLGFEKARQSGSHVVLPRGSKGCVVPLHAELYFARPGLSRSRPSPEGGHAHQFAHVLAKRGYEGEPQFCPREV